jgi:hypothetical protein
LRVDEIVADQPDVLMEAAAERRRQEREDGPTREELVSDKGWGVEGGKGFAALMGLGADDEPSISEAGPFGG